MARRAGEAGNARRGDLRVSDRVEARIEPQLRACRGKREGRGRPKRLRKNYCGTVEIHWSARLGQTRSVWSIWLVSCNQTNQTDRTYQINKIGRRTSIDSEEFDLACRCFAQIQHSTLMFCVQLGPFHVVEMSHWTTPLDPPCSGIICILRLARWTGWTW